MFTVFSIFMLTYIITSVLPTFKFVLPNKQHNASFLPKGLTKAWFKLHGQSIFLSTFTTSATPYVIGPFKDILLYKCCKKKFERGNPSKKLRLNEKYGLILNMGFVVMTFCFALPMLLVSGALSFCFQFVVDRLLITYWYDEYPIHSDQLNTFVLEVFKYAPSVMLLFAGMCVYQGKNLITNEPVIIEYTNQLPPDQLMWAVPIILCVIGGLYFVGLLIHDIVQLIKYRN